MGSIIYFDGMRIEVPTRELAEALRQIGLVRSLGGAAPSPVQTVMDLSIPTVPVPPHPSGPEPAPVPPGSLEPSSEPASTNKEMALNFLRVISDHAVSGGAPISAVMFALGAMKEQGVGSKAAVVNRVLDSAGFAIPDVYTNARDVHGDRYWKAGERLQDAIAALRVVDPHREVEKG